jgi:hypothetical protein
MQLLIKFVSQVVLSASFFLIMVGISLDWHGVPSDTSYGWAIFWLAASGVAWLMTCRSDV